MPGVSVPFMNPDLADVVLEEGPYITPSPDARMHARTHLATQTASRR